MKTIKLIPRQNKPVTRLSTSNGGFNMYQKGGLLVNVPKFQDGGNTKVMASAKHGTHGMMGGHENTQVSENLDLSMDQFGSILNDEQRAYLAKNPERGTQLYERTRAEFNTEVTRLAEQIMQQNPRANKQMVHRKAYEQVMNKYKQRFNNPAPAADVATAPSSRSPKGNMVGGY